MKMLRKYLLTEASLSGFSHWWVAVARETVMQQLTSLQFWVASTLQIALFLSRLGRRRNTMLVILAHELFWMVWSRQVRIGGFIHWRNIWLVPGIVVGARYTTVNKDTVSSRNILTGPIRGTSTNQAAPPSHQSPMIWMPAQQGLSSNLPSSDKHKLFLVFSQSHVW